MAAESSFSDRIADHVLVVDEDFDGDDLDETVWLPYYLPQWAGRERSRASARVEDGRLCLFIADDQPPWLPAVDPHLRVSSLQTGCYAGPVGSTVGQHRTHDVLRVTEEQPTLRLLTPTYGAIELRSRWQPHPDQMVALWMIGFEDRPDRSAEICVCEIFGREATSASAVVGCGVHPFADPTIADDFEKVPLAIDVRDWHDYAVVWTADDVTFFVDGAPIKQVDQSPDYPMQLMLNIYDFAEPAPGRSAPFEIDRIRLHQLPFVSTRRRRERRGTIAAHVISCPIRRC